MKTEAWPFHAFLPSSGSPPDSPASPASIASPSSRASPSSASQSLPFDEIVKWNF